MFMLLVKNNNLHQNILLVNHIPFWQILNLSLVFIPIPSFAWIFVHLLSFIEALCLVLNGEAVVLISGSPSIDATPCQTTQPTLVRMVFLPKNRIKVIDQINFPNRGLNRNSDCKQSTTCNGSEGMVIYSIQFQYV